MRLDKFLVTTGVCTRSEAKTFIKKGFIRVNGNVVKSNDMKINECTDCVMYKEDTITYQSFYYYMLHKPAGVVTATEDKSDKTVMDLLGASGRKDMFPVGRLDKDTEGLLLITNDGALSHKLLSPKKHVEKTYLVHTKNPIDESQKNALEQGVDIGEKALTLPAKVEILEEYKLLLTICEGKFHQVKRMLKAVDNEVCYLKRMKFGPLCLDEELEIGTFRPLTEDEISELRGCIL